jgi:hypothetical protein
MKCDAVTLRTPGAGDVTANAQTILWRASKQGVRIRLNAERLRVTPGNEATKALLPEIRAHKPELLRLVADLEQAGAQDDSLILEALALFNARIAAVVQKTPATEQACFNLAA